MGLGGLGMWEMLLIFLVVLLLFGAKRLPEIGSSLGKGIREFKGSIREIEKEVNKVTEPARDAVTPPADSSTEPDEEGPRRLTTSPVSGSAGSQPGGVPTQDGSTQDAPNQDGLAVEATVEVTAEATVEAVEEVTVEVGEEGAEEEEAQRE